MLIDPRSRTTESEPGTGGGARSSLLAGVRARVLVSFLALLVLSTAASVFVLREVLVSRIDSEVERSLMRDVEALQPLSEGGRQIEQLFDDYLARSAPPPGGALMAYIDGQLYDASVANPSQGELVDAFAEIGTTTEPLSGSRETSLGDAQFVAVPVAGNPSGALVAAALTRGEREQVESAVRIAIGVSIVVLLLASLFIWLAAGRAVAPLQALARTARTISETDLTGRIPVRGSDELAELGRTFNGMLDRLETAFADQKDFLSDVSHELRTPITVIRGHVETLGDSPAEREEAIAVIQDELNRMNRFVDDLLLLTKASRPDFLRTGPIDLDLFTHDVFSKARSLADRDWHLDGTGVGIIVGDQHRLTQAVMNLADNAARHTLEREAVWIGSSLVGDQARLWVRDEGPGVDAADRERIFDRYARGEAPRPSRDGAGLGLSIVSAVAEAHGGTVELSSRGGVGSTFTIVIPATPTP